MGNSLSSKPWSVTPEDDTDNIMTKYISSQILNPLNAAFSTLQLIQAGLQINPDQASEILRLDAIQDDDETLGLQRMTIDAKVSCLNAMRIIESVTTYERLMRNQILLKIRLLTLKAELDDTFALHNFYIKASGINVKSTIDATVTLAADSFQLKNAISSLIFNAMKVSGIDGEVVIACHQVISNTEDWAPEKFNGEFIAGTGFLRIGITDKGPGMSKKQTDALENHWVNFLSPELHDSQGYDLSIWVSNRVLAMTGGRIAVYSAGKGFGSTFFIELPQFDPDSFVAPPTNKNNK